MRKEYELYIDGGWTPQTDGCVREDEEIAAGAPLCLVHPKAEISIKRLSNLLEIL